MEVLRHGRPVALMGGEQARGTGATTMLVGRRQETEMLERMLTAVHGGQGAAVVLSGESGAGKTALLQHAVRSGSDLQVAYVAGVEGEQELAFAAVHQLYPVIRDRFERLPDPQREALATILGLSAGEGPDRLLIGLAMLQLLSEAAAERPLLCVVDDAHWLDRPSAQVFAFVARRLRNVPIAMILATRDTGDELRGLPEQPVAGLPTRDALELLETTGCRLDEPVGDRIVAETRGNPLALLELARGLTPARLAGGFGLPGAVVPPARIQDSLQRELAQLPAATRTLMLVAAAEPLGESLLVWDAAQRLEIGQEARYPAEEAGLVEFGTRVRFRDPFVRFAIYQVMPLHERRRVHRALAEATDAENDADRRAWHLGQAVAGPDEKVALQLERSARLAASRGGPAAAAAFLERSAALTLEPARRAERALAAAEAMLVIGAQSTALELLGIVDSGPPEEFRRARAGMLRARVAYLQRSGEASRLLLAAARRLEPLDARLARDTYLEALWAGTFADPAAGGVSVTEVARAAQLAPSAKVQPPRAPDLLLDGLARVATDGYAAGAPVLKRALLAFRDGPVSTEEQIRWLGIACHSAMLLFDDDAFHSLSVRQLQLVRSSGAVAALPWALHLRLLAHAVAGELGAAAKLLSEQEAAAESTGVNVAPDGHAVIAALRGDEPEAPGWMTALLCNGLSHYDDALGAPDAAGEHMHEPAIAVHALRQEVEAAVRSGRFEQAAAALERLSGATRASGTDWALGVDAVSRAVVCDDGRADALYREAIDRLGRTRARVELARAQLLYGEWLRRERRRADARERLRIAHAMFTTIGMRAFADRAARELRATGETAHKRTIETRDDLTAQEAQIASLARDGLSNPEIAARLFVSSSTVAYHLRKVFVKLEITSRTQLDRALPERAQQHRDAETIAA